jgi:hypothetical protein
LAGVSKATNRDGGKHGVVFEHRIGVLTGDRKGGVWRTPSPRERTRAWRAGTHLQQTLIETSCAIGMSGGVKTAPLWIRHGQGRLEIKLAAGQPFNNEHGTGANRTSQMSCWVRLVCAVRAEQIAAAGPHIATSAISEKSEVADADQALRQNVDQESAQELIGGDRHDFLFAAVRIVFPAKRDSIIVERNQSMVGDGDAVRIASEIVQNMLGTAEGWLGIDDPVLLEELSEKLAKATRIDKTLE